MSVKIFTDGGARGNPGPAACAFVVFDEKGDIFEKKGKYLGRATNNVAEYEAVALALEWIRKLVGQQISGIEFFLDSNLVVNQLNGIFKVKDVNLRELFAKIKNLESELRVPVSYSFVRRENNFEADKLVNETLDREQAS